MGKALNCLESYQYLQIYFHWYLKQCHLLVNHLFPGLQMGRRAQRVRWGPERQAGHCSIGAALLPGEMHSGVTQCELGFPVHQEVHLTRQNPPPCGFHCPTPAFSAQVVVVVVCTGSRLSLRRPRFTRPPKNLPTIVALGNQG